MIRTGIYSLNQLSQGDLKDFFGKEKNISIYLYQKINQNGNSDNNAKLAELILNRFNSDRNVIKRTYKNRFDFFDNVAIAKIREQNFERVSVLDIAISDGRASCHFLKQAINELNDFYYTGTDIQIFYYIHKKKPVSRSYIITDEEKKIIEITYPPFVWNLARKEGRPYLINNLLKAFFKKKAHVALLKNKYKCQERIELLHQDFKLLLAQNNNFKCSNYNLHNEVPEQFTVIRAMNILHTGYFSKSQLYSILNNLYNGLKVNGLLVEGSNENAGTNVEGAIYKKSEMGFQLLNEPENPSRIKDLILSFSPNLNEYKENTAHN
jgi:hypothetical protein